MRLGVPEVATALSLATKDADSTALNPRRSVGELAIEVKDDLLITGQ